MNNTLEGLKVLIIDDDLISLGAFQLALIEEMAEVRSAGSVDEAFEILRTWIPEIVVSDIGMPQQDGLSLIRRLRALDATRSIPAVALTGYSSPKETAQMKAAGYQVVLSKPVHSNELVRVLQSLR